jgi:hypothetical protein
MKGRIIVNGQEVVIKTVNEQDYLSLTDMAKKFNDRPDIPIQGWLKNANTIRFLELWEQMHNPDFNPSHMAGIKENIGLNSYYLSAKKWIEETGAIGIESRPGRYGGTFAHVDIAFEFASWLSPEFKLYLILEFKRLKHEEAERLSQGWDFRRLLSKVNYPLQTEAIRENIIPRLAKGEHGLAYATEADIINIALFGCTAKQWREANPDLAAKGNMRDHASALELTVLSNLESFNSQLIRKGAGKENRLEALMDMARFQLGVFAQDDRLKIDNK